MIVTIDGPAGAGKSSVARALAERLRFWFLDTGAMYRAVTLAVLERDLPWDDVEQLIDRVEIQFRDDQVLLDDRPVTERIRTPDVTRAVRHVADNPAIRQWLVRLQRQFAAEKKDVVAEGRDQGTVVFPAAECKIYLTASDEERARRRWQQLQAQGSQVALEEVLAEQIERDRRDAARPVGGLIAADDAVRVVTDGLSEDQVTDQLESLVRARMKTVE